MVMRGGKKCTLVRKQPWKNIQGGMLRQKDSNKIMVVDESWCSETKDGAEVVFRDKCGERWCAEHSPLQ